MLKKSNKNIIQSKKIGIFFVSLVLALSLSFSAHAASLTLEEKQLSTNVTDFSLLVTLDATADDHIASFDFTLTYDTEKVILNSISDTLHLQASGKTLETNEDVLGTVKGIVYALNQSEISSGDVFQLNFSTVDGIEDGVIAISLSDIHASCSSATCVTISAVNNLVTIGTKIQTTPSNLTVPTITNTETLINQDYFTLQWTDESASGATNYLVTRARGYVSPMTLSDGLVSYWPFNEVSGNAIDSFGSNALIDTNSVLSSSDTPAGKVPGSRNFSAVSQEELIIDKQNQSGLDFESQMTWSAWIKPNTLRKMNILNSWDIPDQLKKYYNLSITERGELKAIVSSDGRMQNVCISNAAEIKAGVWQHIAMSANVDATKEPFVDATDRHSVSSFGNVVIDEEDRVVGPSVHLLDKQSGFSAPASSDFDFGNDAFTIDFWVKLDENNFDCSYFVGQLENVGKRWSIVYRDDDSMLSFHWMNRSRDYGGDFNVKNLRLEKEQWYHIAVVRTGPGNAFNFFINGVKHATNYNSDSQLCSFVNAPLYIGRRSDGADGFKGKLDQMRITKGVARWTDNFDPTVKDASNKDKDVFFMPFGGSSEIKLYVNGQDVSQEAIEEEVTIILNETEPLRIGSGIQGSDYFDGLMADLACWNRPLDNNEIAVLSFADRETSVVSNITKEENDINDGEYIYMVQSSDDDGYVSDYSQAYEIAIDTTPPASPTILTAQTLFDSKTIVMTGTCPSDTHLLEIFSGTVTVDALVVAGADWSATLSVIDDGAHQISVIASDEAGNLSSSADKLFNIDTIAPVASFVSPVETVYTVPRKNVLFKGSATDDSAITAHFRFVTISNTGEFDVPINNGNFEFTYTLERGSNQCWVTITDGAGNETVQEFTITYANNLPLEFDGLKHHAVSIDEAVTFIVSITHQNDIDPDLLNFSAINLPDEGSNNPATFDTNTRVFAWTPNDRQEGLYAATFTVDDGLQSVSQTIKIAARNYDFDVLDLEAIVGMPQDHQAVIFDFNQDGHQDIFEAIQGNNKLYMNRGDETFVEVAESAGVADSQGLGNATVAADFNGDGWDDIYVVNEGENKFFINNHDGTFRDETIAYGVGDTGIGMDVVVADYDNDNDIDIYVLNDGKNIYYENDGLNNYIDKTDSAYVGCAGTGINTCVFDSNNDGLLDIFVVNEGSDTLYINAGNGEFIDATDNIHGNHDTRGYKGMHRDFNNDGNLDMYLLNSKKNIIYQNDGQGVFKTVEIVKVENSAAHSKCSYYIDYDNDNNLDLFIVDQSAKYVDGFGNILFHNDGDGQFTDMTAIAELF
ncbi:LamG-like jellyroll fold domain-containing protein [Candidatus Omnitrophota bacterium]